MLLCVSSMSWLGGHSEPLLQIGSVLNIQLGTLLCSTEGIKSTQKCGASQP